MKFHPIYAGRFAMGLPNLDADAPGIIATQSTHKQLASFSQASQIHVKDCHIRGQRRRVEHRRFNESFLLHASTSPFYPLFASLDVGAQMMKGRSGEVLWDDTIRLGIELRKKLRAVRRGIRATRSRSGAALVLRSVRARCARLPDAADERGVTRCPGKASPPTSWRATPHFWELSPGARWHGFAQRRARLRHHRSEQADPADAGLRPHDRRLRGAWRSGPGRRPVPAREPRRAGKNRPQLAVVPAHARRRIEQGRHAAQRAGRVQAAARRQRAARRASSREFVAGRRHATAGCGCATSAAQMHAFFRDRRRQRAAAGAVPARASAGAWPCRRTRRCGS